MVSRNSGALLGERQVLEDEYMRDVMPEVETFLRQVEKHVLAGFISAVTVFALWDDMVSRITAKNQSVTLKNFLTNSTLPADALRASTDVLAALTGQDVSGVARAGMVREALGLDDERFGVFDSEQTSGSWKAHTESSTRTAATADFSREMLDIAQAEGYTHKRWMTRFDSRVRDTHRRADRQTVLLDDSFTVGGELLSYPGDPFVSNFELIVNCRCVLALVRFGDRPWDLVGEPWNNPYPG